MLTFIPGIPLWIGLFLMICGGAALLIARGFRRWLACIAVVVGILSFFHPPQDEPKARSSAPTSEPLNVAPLLTQDPREEPTDGFFFTQVSLNIKPPFFNGPLPVEFKARRGAGGPNGSLITYSMTFDSFRDRFMYFADSIYTGIPFGAVSYDNNGVRRAEAKLIESNDGSGGLVIEELHYTVDRMPIFHCKSRISLTTGFKESEFEIEGAKEKDYYFIWPVRPD